MAQRITRDNVEFYMNRLNAALETRKSDVRYKVVGSGTGLTIEYYKGDAMIDTLRSGLKTAECYHIVHCMFHVVTDGFPA